MMPVNVRVTAQEPGWVMITFKESPNEDRDREGFLQRTLQGWLQDNRQYIVQKVQKIRFQEKLYGLNVFYDVAPKEAKLHLNVNVDLAMQTKFGKEYLEAVIADAAQFISTTKLQVNAVALTNRREITVIVDRREQKAFILPLARFRKQIDTNITKNLDEWLASTQPGYFCVPVAKRKK